MEEDTLDVQGVVEVVGASSAAAGALNRDRLQRGDADELLTERRHGRPVGP